MSDDLVAFLRARLDEDERIAGEAMWLPGGVHGEQWRVSGSHSDAGGTYWSITTVNSDIDRVPTLEMVGSGMSGGGAHTEEVATHIAAHDPARVLDEITAKRALMDVVFAYEAKIDGEWACCHSADEIAAGECERAAPETIPALRLLATPYAGHADYRPEWAPNA